jgi:hypothetical protein
VAFDKIKDSSEINNFYCIPPQYNITIGGAIDQGDFSASLITLNQCNPNKRECYSPE